MVLLLIQAYLESLSQASTTPRLSVIVVSALLARCSKAARYSGGWSRQIVKIYISIMIHHWLKIFLIAVTLLVPGIIGVYHQTVLRSLICPNFPMAVYDGSDKNAQMFLLFLPVRTESKSLPRPIMIQLVNSNHSALVSIMTQNFPWPSINIQHKHACSSMGIEDKWSSQF